MGRAQKKAAAQRNAIVKRASASSGKKSSKGSSNPFDVYSNARQKFGVLNRRVKGENRNVAKARSEAVERRKRTLLKEYQSSKKSSTFSDRRIGEGDDSLTVEDRMMERFRRERQRRARNKDVYRLKEGDDKLTHGGRVLEDDDYDKMGGDRYESDDDGALDEQLTRELHFGGGEQAARRHGEDGEKKSRKEIIDEMIARSKVLKMQRAAEKEERLEATAKLDDAFSEISKLLNFRPTRDDKDYVAPEKDDFDIMARGIAMETKRSRASDRTKTPAEAAAEEAQRLKELEEQRLRRQRGEEPETKRRRTDDDLDDDPRVADDGPSAGAANPHAFQFQQFVQSEGEDSDAGEEGEEGEEGDGGDEGSTGSESDGAGEDGELMSRIASRAESDDEEYGDGDVNDAFRAAGKRGEQDEECAAAGVGGAAAEAEMPYTFECPRSVEELNGLVNEHTSSAEDVATLLTRILACNSLKIPEKRGSGEARAAMHEFYTLLLRRLEDVGSYCAAAELEGPGSEDRAAFARQLDDLGALIFDATADMREVAAARWVGRLVRLQRRLEKLLRDRRDGVELRHSCFPEPGRLLLLRLCASVWPTSDRRHPVTTPAAVLLGQLLAEAHVGPALEAARTARRKLSTLRSAFGGDVEWGVSAAALCAHLAVQWGAEAKRFHPEALSFLRGALAHFAAPPAALAEQDQRCVAALCGLLDTEAAPPAEEDAPALQSAAAALHDAARQRLGNVSAPPIRTVGLFWLRHAAAAWSPPESGGEGAAPRLRLCSRSSAELGGAERSEAAAGVLASVYRGVGALVPILRESGAARALLGPLDAALSRVRPGAYPKLCDALTEMHVACHEAVRAALEGATDRPLRWQVKPLEVLESLAPRVESRSLLRKDKNVTDRDELERRQLKRQIAREKRGAVRELKRDAEFLQRERERELAERKAERRAEIKRNMAWLEQEQATINQMVKKGGSLMKELKGGGSGAAKRKPKIKNMRS